MLIRSDTRSINGSSYLRTRLPKPPANRAFEQQFPAPIDLNRTGFLYQPRPLACHRYPRSTQGPIHPKSPGAAVLFEQLQVPGLVLGNLNQGPPHLNGGATVRSVVLDLKCSPLIRSLVRASVRGQMDVAGAEVELRSMIIRRLVRRGEFALSLPVTGC